MNKIIKLNKADFIDFIIIYQNKINLNLSKEQLKNMNITKLELIYKKLYRQLKSDLFE